jgi:SAM-dependent methyltransferase
MSSPPADAAARIIGLYDANAVAWDRQRSRNLFERPWLERFAALVPHGGAVLDLGCGMGEPIARWLIERGYSVTGIDSSPALIALCRDRFPGQSWLADDMRSIALGRRFDGLIAWHSLFHLTRDDQRRIFTRFAAHAAPGAPLMFTSGSSDGESIGSWQGEPLYHASLAPEEYRSLVEANGLVLVDHRIGDPACGHATIWLAQMRPASGLDGSA